ncbi:MAG: cytochrome c, partial [Ignavibacteriaceae bacterium]|nr:cytochrome c [Ignavibacteriaceae bacterium]
LIGRLGCSNCHGQNLDGTASGPALVNISQNWNKNELTNYLRSPSSFIDNTRFKAFREKYPNVIMPSFGNVNVQELGKIAEYLLTK